MTDEERLARECEDLRQVVAQQRATIEGHERELACAATLAKELSSLASERGELRKIVDAQRELLAVLERNLEGAMRKIEALENVPTEIASPAEPTSERQARKASGTIEVAFGAENVHEHGALLELGRDAGELCHLLRGRSVRPGDTIEVRALDGTWLAGRYDWTGFEHEPPTLAGVIGGTRIPLPRDAHLRWPRGEDRSSSASG